MNKDVRAITDTSCTERAAAVFNVTTMINPFAGVVVRTILNEAYALLNMIRPDCIPWDGPAAINKSGRIVK